MVCCSPEKTSTLPFTSVAETPCGMLNAVGLQNDGVESFLKNKLPRLPWHETPVIANLYATSPAEFAELAGILAAEEGIAGLEVNISCPNVKNGGVLFGQDPALAAEVTQAVKKHAGNLPVIVKLSPNVTDITAIAKAAEQAGADAISCINTITAMGVDVKPRKPLLANGGGGRSAPAVKPVALRCVWQVCNAVKIPVIGIGGISMSGLAEILADKGCIVSGTDIKESPVTKHLQNLGIHINFGHKAENITDDVDLVVYTAAIHPDNPEYQAAQAKHIPLMDRARLLGEIMAEYEDSIAVAGTHGKTTTTSMVSEILLAAGTDPTITVGGILPTISSNLKIGHSPYFVAEACEYFDSFLQFKPFVGVILNVESDHLDYFKSLANIRRSFHAFAERIPAKGALVINQAIENVAELTQGLDCTVETFGLADGADWQAKNIIHEPDGKNTFDVYYKGELFGNFHLNVPGDHNITNAVASIAAAHFVGVCPADCQKGLLHFTGTERRFQKKGEKNGVVVIDDYAHHPTEIKAALAAAKKVQHRTTWCVFQPHTYSRTKFLFDAFGEAFTDADEVIIADIYAARESDDGTISAAMLADRIAKTGKSARYVGDFDAIRSYLEKNCKAGDLLLTVGAGDVFKIGEAFLEN